MYPKLRIAIFVLNLSNYHSLESVICMNRRVRDRIVVRGQIYLLYGDKIRGD